MSNVNFLTDVEILKWNDRLIGSDYVVKPTYGHKTSYPELMIFQKSRIGSSLLGYNDQLQSMDPSIKFDFIFSVASNRTQNFFDIFEKIINREFVTEFVYNSPGNNQPKSYTISIPDDLIKFKGEEEHYLLKKKYTKYTYKFTGKLSSIMCYVSCLTDTINIFELMWGYDEDSNEKCLLEYPIGTIVSIKKDKSKDYLVLEYKYEKSTNGEFEIKFICSEMLNTDSCIIQYGDTKIYKSDELCYSRNNRIDDILN